jgi:hypothetical protein
MANAGMWSRNSARAQILTVVFTGEEVFMVRGYLGVYQALSLV